MEVHKGVFVFGPSTTVYVETEDSGVRRVGEHLCTLLSSSMGRSVPSTLRPGRPAQLHLLSLRAPRTLGPEGYEMRVSPDTIRIGAATVAGLFYGVQTLRQMLPPESESNAPGKSVSKCPAWASRTALASPGGV